MVLEVEQRSFISKSQYQSLLEFFNQNAESLFEDTQETHYFDCPQDVRIQKNERFSKVWLKKGKMHDDARKEIEIKFEKNDFEKVQELFSELSYKTTVKWFRKRHAYKYKDITVMIDYNKGYGYIIEFEKITEEKNKEQALQQLKQIAQSLNIPITPKEEFQKQYDYYINNWEQLTNE